MTDAELNMSNAELEALKAENERLRSGVSKLEEKFNSRAIELKRLKGRTHEYKAVKRCLLDLRKITQAALQEASDADS